MEEDQSVQKCRRSQKERRQLMAELRRLYGKNYTDEDVLDELKISPHVLAEYKKQLLNADRKAFTGLDPVTAFSDYVMKVRQVVRELDEAIDICRSRGQGQALVSAIWRKKEAYDSLLTWGQEFGFVARKATELKVSSELSFSTMSEDEVKKEVKRELERLNALATQGMPMRAEVLDMMPEAARRALPGNIIAFPAASTKPGTQIKAKVKLIVRSKG